MRTMILGASTLEVPVIALGCMRMSKLTPAEAETWVGTALDAGATFFDHADIYGGGESEARFAQAFAAVSGRRSEIILQSKCGIRKGMYDASSAHILEAVNGSLARLKTDYLDVLLLHRPDALMEPEEVAEAFDRLHAAGKVRHFGVSNQRSMQIQLLQRALRQPILVNQLQMSIAHAYPISSGMNVNVDNREGSDRDGSVLDFCRLHSITPQPWSPFYYGFFEGVFLGSEKFPALNEAIDALAEKYGVTNTAIAVAWLLRHPARMQPVVGTMTPQRVKDAVKAADITLAREEWYALYRAAGHILP